MSQTAGLPVIDADGHVIEPRGMWQEYIENRFKERAPRSAGPFTLVIDGQPSPKMEGTNRIVDNDPGLLEAHRDAWVNKYREALEERFSVESYLRDMDREGIDLAVLFPTQGLFATALDDLDPEFAAAIARAYNNWLADFCRNDPTRLKGVAMIPLQYVDEAVKEARRARRDLGMTAVFVRPNPIHGRNLNDPYYDPLYAELQDLDMAFTTHEGMGVRLPAAGADRFDHPFFSHICSHALEQMIACLSIVGGGVCEKFPRLQFAFLESGCGWLPYWLERMDEHFEWMHKGVSWLKMKPSEYFQRQCYVGSEPGEESLPQVVELVGDERIVWASDYPRPDSKYPRAVAATRDLPGLSEASKRKILADNARRLYRLY